MTPFSSKTALLKLIVSRETLFFRWSVTQTKTLKEQLDLGVRYFDLRCTARADDHHIYYRNGTDILYALREFKRWMADHPKEVIILDFREMHQVSESQHKRLLSEMTRDTFVDKLIEYTGNIQAVTLRNMWGVEAQIIVIYPSEVQINTVTLVLETTCIKQSTV